MKNKDKNKNNPASKPYTNPYARQLANVTKTTGMLPMMKAIILKMSDVSGSFTTAETDKGIKYNTKNKNIKNINSYI